MTGYKPNHRKAFRCVRWLLERGFHVKRIDFGLQQPCIEIEHHPNRCRQLGGHWYIRIVRGNQVTYRMAALLHGCQVEWDERRVV